MPPKKASNANGEAGETGGKFTWDSPNDIKLLLLTQGRYVKPDEFEKLSTVFPGTTPGGIRNRISSFRVKQRTLYEQLSWDLPSELAATPRKAKNEAAGTSTTTARSAKRGSVDEGNDAASEASPCKKARKKVSAAMGKKGVKGGEGFGVVVKKEVVEDEDEDEV